MTDQNGTPLRTCKRCSTNPSVINLRTEHLCNDCFDKYLRSKCVKRTDAYRVRYSPPDTDTSPRRLLLPLSLGASSITLLHLLANQLLNQISRTGRTGFTLLAVHVDESAIDPSVPPAEASMVAVRERFPHVGGYKVVLLEDIYEFPDAARAFESSSSKGKDKRQRLQELVASLPSASSRMDMLQILRTRLLVALARGHACEAVLWGDSTTRLAEKTLAETAKGRGYSVPWQTEDGDSPYGVKFLYPLRDVLKKEIAVYVTLDVPWPLRPLCVGAEEGSKKYAAVGKGITIDELMTQYFEGIERQYPSIVANVVRTVGKLVTEGGVVRIKRCRICGLPRDGDGGGLVLAAKVKGRGSATEGEGVRKEQQGGDMCYGCARSVHGAKPYEWPLD